MRTRREFLRSSFRASLALSAGGALGPASLLASPQSVRDPRPRAPVREGSPAERHSDLPRHLLFEYYPWYGGPPGYDHWTQWDRVPPLDLASNYVPRLGAYESGSRTVVEQHARWIAEAGAGGISLSWWGPDSFEDRNVNVVMDVMKDHGLKVAFHMEPYGPDRSRRWSSDVVYLLREYGQRRRWDALLLLRNADGSEGPLFKSFYTVLPERVRDCHGVEQRVEGYTPDSTWRRQNDAVRDALRHDFDHVTLLCDSSDFRRVAASGFDGMAIYDPFVAPAQYAPLAAGASREGLLFAFNANPGYDSIARRSVEPGSCYVPPDFAPPTFGLDWRLPEHRQLAAQRSRERIAESFAAALATQTDRALSNYGRGFFLLYLNSFNEWHEGHAFEPMKDAGELTEVERAFGYHNPERGGYRMETLASLMSAVVRPAVAA